MLMTLGGRISCPQCTAVSKRTGVQCKAPAMRGKTKCAIHGGKSTGPKTPEGRERSASAPLKHGRDTVAAKAQRRAASLHRHPASVGKDVSALAEVGLVQVEKSFQRRESAAQGCPQLSTGWKSRYKLNSRPTGIFHLLGALFCRYPAA